MKVLKIGGVDFCQNQPHTSNKNMWFIQPSKTLPALLIVPVIWFENAHRKISYAYWATLQAWPHSARLYPANCSTLHTDHVEENIIQKTKKQNYQLYMYGDRLWFLKLLPDVKCGIKTAKIVQLGPSNGLWIGHTLVENCRTLILPLHTVRNQFYYSNWYKNSIFGNKC